MTSQEPATPHSDDRDAPDTEVIIVSSPAPVFVDSTGRRRRFLRRLSYAFGALCVIYGGLVSVSLAGGPVSSSAVLPLPDLRDDAEQAAGPRPAPIPAPSASSRRPEMFATVLPRRPAPATVNRVAVPRRTARVVPSPTPAKTPLSPAPSSAKPVESTTAPSTPATPAPSATTPVTVPPIKAPVPPAPPLSTGGGGGGGAVPEADDETVSAPAAPEEDGPPAGNTETEATAQPANTEPEAAETEEAEPADEQAA